MDRKRTSRYARGFSGWTGESEVMNRAKFGASVMLLAMLALPPLARPQAVGDHQYTSEAIELGSRIYTSQCALCHGPQGALVDGIDLRLGIFRGVASDEDLRRVIAEGSGEGQMPATALGENEMEGIIAYIRAGFDPEGVAVRIGDAARGEELFYGRGGCADCHRVNGEGPRTAPDLSDIGAIRTPAVLQLNLLDPAAALMPINRAVRLVTFDEEVVSGRRLNEDTHTVQVLDSAERLRSFAKAELGSFEISREPSKPPIDMNEEEVADLVAFLLTLRGAL
ncbi:MAG: c-type cytochrome [Gammaproteobacteria bacterium]|nr:c-type cytochrome [Gammaproteobacteria bacterium]MYH47733.1 c-type cytochrome [Gammaproteobacteria bacterium]MYL14282.1 c-type cytochrome [Gammaproteobacteria bacterium]